MTNIYKVLIFICIVLFAVNGLFNSKIGYGMDDNNDIIIISYHTDICLYKECWDLDQFSSLRINMCANIAIDLYFIFDKFIDHVEVMCAFVRNIEFSTIFYRDGGVVGHLIGISLVDESMSSAPVRVVQVDTHTTIEFSVFAIYDEDTNDEAVFVRRDALIELRVDSCGRIFYWTYMLEPCNEFVQNLDYEGRVLISFGELR